MRRLALLLAGGLALVASATASPSNSVLPGFGATTYGSVGGTVLEGYIPGRDAPAAATSKAPSYVYLPPGFSTSQRYPVVYLLHGMPGTPRIYVGAPSHLARVAGQLIAAGAQPFVAVAPYAGPATHRGSAEWAGRWEDYLVHDVVPWTDAHLPTIRSAAGRALAGLSAGGFGAVDIGLRHPGLFGTLESWSGYFEPLRDGPFANASDTYLAQHDPTLLVRGEAVRLRRDGVRLELSSGVGHGKVSPAMTAAFGSELRALGLRHALWYVPASVRGPGYAEQLQHGLAYAFARG